MLTTHEHVPLSLRATSRSSHCSTPHPLPLVQAIARAMVADGLEDVDNADNERAPPDVYDLFCLSPVRISHCATSSCLVCSYSRPTSAPSQLVSWAS